LRFVALLAVFLSITVVATHVSAQTPDDPTVTPEPTELAAPSVTPALTPTPAVIAAPDEIVFTGELAVPAGTTVRALFEGVSSATCATAPVSAASPEVSSFALRVPASCAEHRIGPTICWSDSGCYLYLAGQRVCDFSRGGCGWSDIVAPGKVVDFGTIPIAGPDEVLVVGQVPVPAGSTVTIRFADFRSQSISIVVCGTATTTGTGDAARSDFILHVSDSCSQGLDFPGICWKEPPCHIIWFDNPLMGFPGAGTTIALPPFLDPNDPNATPTALPHPPSTGGGPYLPTVGGYQAGRNPVDPTWLAIVLGALFAAAIAFGAAGLSLKRFRP
jgi:hypothetical protein